MKENENHLKTNNNDKIPKIIWCYWHTKNLPLLIKKCFKSIIDNHPDYQVYLLHNDDIPKEIFKLKLTKNNHTKTSDLVRLWFLKHYGGVWIDISSLFTEPITLVHDYELNCYYLEKKNYIESWYIAAKENSNIISMWYNELVYANSFNSIEDYISHAKNENEEYITGIPYPEYLWIHVALRKILVKHPELKKNIKLFDAYDGPFKLHFDGQWNHDKMKTILNQGKNSYNTNSYKTNSYNTNSYKTNPYTYIKLRSNDRKYLGEESFISENEKQILKNFTIDERYQLLVNKIHKCSPTPVSHKPSSNNTVYYIIIVLFLAVIGLTYVGLTLRKKKIF